MAIANGNVRQFLQGTLFGYLTIESHAGMSLPTAVRRVQDLATSRESKGTFWPPVGTRLGQSR